MFFTMSCPHCDKSLKVRDELVGNSARCPHCRGSITVKRPEVAAGSSGSGKSSSGATNKQSAESIERARVLSVTANTNVNVGLYILLSLIHI